MERWAKLRRINIAVELAEMVGSDAVAFRSKQREALEAIQGGKSPIVAVMPTGAGKSILFMLPAWVTPGGVTVVVVPLVALRADMLRRCLEMNISCAEWGVRRPPNIESIVLVTPEAAVRADFLSFVERLKATKQLDRIVIDECHVMLRQRDDFRRKT